MMILFWILMLAVFGRMIGFAMKCAWGITKILFRIVLLPIVLIGLVFGGLLYLALPILLILGIVMMFSGAAAS